MVTRSLSGRAAALKGVVSQTVTTHTYSTQYSARTAAAHSGFTVASRWMASGWVASDRSLHMRAHASACRASRTGMHKRAMRRAEARARHQLVFYGARDTVPVLLVGFRKQQHMSHNS